MKNSEIFWTILILVSLILLSIFFVPNFKLRFDYSFSDFILGIFWVFIVIIDFIFTLVGIYYLCDTINSLLDGKDIEWLEDYKKRRKKIKKKMMKKKKKQKEKDIVCEDIKIENIDVFIKSGV
jgi:energy-coupling factor transporter transmembrane protein EcfT